MGLFKFISQLFKSSVTKDMTIKNVIYGNTSGYSGKSGATTSGYSGGSKSGTSGYSGGKSGYSGTSYSGVSGKSGV